MLVFLIAGFNSCLMGHKLMLLQICPSYVRGAGWKGAGVEMLIMTKWACAFLSLICHWMQMKKEQHHCPLGTAAQFTGTTTGQKSRFWNVMPHCKFNPEQPWGCFLLVLELSWDCRFILRVGSSGLHGVNAQCRLEIMMVYCCSFLFVGENVK